MEHYHPTMSTFGDIEVGQKKEKKKIGTGSKLGNEDVTPSVEIFTDRPSFGTKLRFCCAIKSRLENDIFA